MYKIVKKILGFRNNKCVGYDVRCSQTGLVGSMSKEMVHGLVSCGLVDDVEIDKKGRLIGLNGYKSSSMKTRNAKEKEVDFCDLSYFENNMNIMKGTETIGDSKNTHVKVTKRANTRGISSNNVIANQVGNSKNIIVSKNVRKLKTDDDSDLEFVKAPTTIKEGVANRVLNNIIEPLSIKVSTKNGYVFIITKTSLDVFNKTLGSISTKSKVEKDYALFSTYLKNWQLKLEDMDLDDYQLVIGEKALNSLKRCILIAKGHKVTGVDMFNIVQPTLYTDLQEFYTFLCKNAILVTD